jgi:hypothetical protein
VGRVPEPKEWSCCQQGPLEGRRPQGEREPEEPEDRLGVVVEHQWKLLEGHQGRLDALEAERNEGAQWEHRKPRAGLAALEPVTER